MKKLHLLFISGLFSVLAITACGQKGPLYLPEDPSEVQSEIPRQASSEDQEGEDSDDQERD